MGSTGPFSCDRIPILKPAGQTYIDALVFVGLLMVLSRKYQPSDSMAEETKQPCSQTGSCQSRLAESRQVWGWYRFCVWNVWLTSFGTRPHDTLVAKGLPKFSSGVDSSVTVVRSIAFPLLCPFDDRLGTNLASCGTTSVGPSNAAG